MKKLIISAILLISLAIIPSKTFAQGMMGWTSSPAATISDDHTAREEAEGKEIWEKLQAKQLECKNLTDDDFGSLGEYFMGQFTGNTERHAAMNQMMTSMMGENGEEQMHITLGKRSSGCNTNAPLLLGYNLTTMMGGWGGFGLGWLSMLLFWGLLALGIIALIRYLAKFGGVKEGKTPLHILKERYARGDISKKEFEEMKAEIKGDF